MTKYIAITGNKKSGKTTTIEHLIDEMKSKHKVGTVKIAFKDVSLDVHEDHYDIARMRKKKPTKTLFQSKQETVIFFNKEMSLREALLAFDSELDYVLMEGFPNDFEGFPQIALLREQKDELEVVTPFTVALSSIPEFSITSKSEKYVPFEKLVTIVEKYSQPLLPALDCKHCGFDSCNDLMVEILHGRKGLEDCYIIKHEHQEVQLKVNDKDIPCNLFVQAVFKNVLLGILKSIKLDSKEIFEVEIKMHNKKEGREISE